MNENEWLWLVIGLVPYLVRTKRLSGTEQILEIRAVFWTATIRCRRNLRCWTIQLPVIRRLRDALWAALMQLVAKVPPRMQ